MAGRQHFADVIRAIHAQSPGTTVEVLTPDFLRKDGAIETVMAARPEVFNHNLETVPRLYLTIRPGARYFASLRLLERAKELMPTGFTKSGLMVGLGESREEIMQVMDDLRAASVDFLTIGQYLQPTRKHARLERFWTPEEFAGLESIARAKGFLMVSASPLTRSSYHADSDFAQLKAARAAHSPSVISHRETPHRAVSGRPDVRVVADVEKYPEFLPWVVALRVLSRGAKATRNPDRGNGGGLWRAARALYQPRARSTPRRAPSTWCRSRARSAAWKTTGGSRRKGRAAKWISPSFSNSRTGCCKAAAGAAFEKVMLKMTDAFEARAQGAVRSAGAAGFSAASQLLRRTSLRPMSPKRYSSCRIERPSRAAAT